MTTRRIAIVGGTLVALAAGSAGAIAATNADEAKEREKTVLDTAAKKLDVTPEQLRDALVAGRAAQLDQAVKDGKITQEQADEIKKRQAESGLVLGGGRGGPGGHRGGPGGGRELMADAAKALGLTEAQLKTQLQSGKTIAEIAEAQNKDLDDVKATVKEAAVARIDAKLKAGDITQAQRDEMVEHLDEHLEHLGERRRGRGPGHGPGGPGAPPARQEGETNQDGSYVPPAVGTTQTS